MAGDQCQEDPPHQQSAADKHQKGACAGCPLQYATGQVAMKQQSALFTLGTTTMNTSEHAPDKVAGCKPGPPHNAAGRLKGTSMAQASPPRTLSGNMPVVNQNRCDTENAKRFTETASGNQQHWVSRTTPGSTSSDQMQTAMGHHPEMGPWSCPPVQDTDDVWSQRESEFDPGPF